MNRKPSHRSVRRAKAKRLAAVQNVCVAIAIASGALVMAAGLIGWSVTL